MASFASKIPSFSILFKCILPLLLLSFSNPAQALHTPIRRGDGHHGGFHGNGAAPSTVDTVTSALATAASTASAGAASSTSSTAYSGGFGTYFYQEGVAGACGTVHSDTDLIVAIDQAMYSLSLCGKTVVVTNTANSKSVNATVADECPGCRNPTSLDMSLGAFETIGDLSTGVLDITWILFD